MKSEGPSSPFRESSGLLELVNRTSPLQLQPNRRVCSPSCTRKLMPELLRDDPVLGSGDLKENLPVAPRNKVSKSGKMKPDDTRILGERNVNLGEDVELVIKEEALDGSLGENVEGASRQGEATDDNTENPNRISQTMLDILDNIDEDDFSAADLPPYHPVHAPFSPRPRFMRLKRPSNMNRENDKEKEKLPQPYDPKVNPLSPRPEFLRYNPSRRREFLESLATSKRSLAFDATEEEVQVPASEEVSGEMKKSTSCPELVTERVEDVPPLESNPGDEGELKTEEDKPRAPELASPGRIKRWCGYLTRGLLLCLLISVFISGCVFLRGNMKEFQQKLMFRTWEWTAERNEENEIAFPRTWDIITPVSNQSQFTLPESEEILVPDDVDDIMTEIGTSTKTEQTVSAPAPEEVGVQDKCSGEGLDETMLEMCMDKTKNEGDALPPPAVRDTEDADEVANKVKETETSPDEAEPEDTMTTADDAMEVKVPEPEAKTSPDKLMEVKVPETEASKTLTDDEAIEVKDPETEATGGFIFDNDFFDEDTLQNVLEDEAEASWVQQILAKVPSYLCSSFLNWTPSILQQRWRQVVASLSLLGVISTLIQLVRKRWYVEATSVQTVSAPSPPAAPSTPSARRPGASTPQQETYATSRGNYIALTADSDHSDASTGSRSENGSNEDRYGSFTTLEARGRGGQLKVTPVRRSSRLQRSSQSPMLRA